MPDATWAVPNLLGGEISKFAQGRFDRPDYGVSMNVCLNAFPTETGTWVRRPGFMFAGTTRGGAAGRVIKFDFEQANAISLEFTDGFVRFRNGAVLLTTNDAKTVLAVSTANPAVVQTSAAVTWATGDTLVFPGIGPAPLLENRQFIATKVDTTHFSLTDSITGAAIDGSTLGAITAGKTVARVMELATAYTGGSWSGIRPVQAETTDILLTGTVAPQALVATDPAVLGNKPTFAISPAIFNDGPYLDPFTNGVQVTPSAKTGIISLTLAFPAYDSTKAYAKDAFVTSSSVNYISLQDQNAGHTPASSPTFWATTAASAAIGPNGFQGSDVGRLVRMFSEPPQWNVATGYVANNIVSYNPSGLPGATTYWQAQGSTTGNAPGSDLTNWKLIPQGAAIWTWGKITSLTTVIDPALSGSANIGDMTGDGGVAASFDGVFSKPSTTCSREDLNGGFTLPGLISVDSYVGKNYSGASDQKIALATVYPSSNHGFAFGQFTSGSNVVLDPKVTLNLRAKATAPTSESDGTLLGTTGQIANTSASVTIVSNDQATAWKYVWIELVSTADVYLSASQYSLANCIAQVSFFSPPSTGTGNGVNVEILGPPLLYTNSIVTWRLGAYSNTTGWPTCGCYHEGRLWLGGAISNRFDGSVSNGIIGGVINFAPTDQYGTVANNNAIAYTLDSDSVNPLFWMQPDLQGIILGTQAGEYLVQAPTTGPLSPTNIAARRVTKIGCANVEPRRTDHTIVFAQRYSKKLMEYFADVYSGKFSAPNIAEKAQHITSDGIVELAYQQATTPIIWGRSADLSMFGVTYKRDTLTTAQGPTFAAWHRQALGSGRLVESICVGPSVGGNLDSVSAVTNDPSNGIRHVEIMTDTLDEETPLTDAWYVDDSAAPTSTVSTITPSDGAPYGGLTLNGLWHLNGKTVQVFAGGLDCGDRGQSTPALLDFVVTAGSCFVPYGDGISAGCGQGLFTADYVASFGGAMMIAVGFTYDSDGQLVRPITPAETGTRKGPGLAQTRRTHRYGLLLNGTKGLSVGTTFDKLYPAIFRLPNNESIGTHDTFTGIHSATLQDDYSYDSMFCWRVSRPYPVNVSALSGNISTQER